MPIASKPSTHALSLWNSVSPTRATSVSLNAETSTEVAIVGGGFTGLSTALHLAKKGCKVCIIEGKFIGWGGSGRNNGQVIPVLSGSEPDDLETRFGETGERFVGLIRDSADELFRLVRDENIDCEAEQTGWFQPAHSSSHVNVSEMRVEAWAKRGAPCQLLDNQETARLLGSKSWHGGMLNPTGGHINPLMLARGLAQVCEQSGVIIYEESPVANIKRNGSGWIVISDNGYVKCNAVLMATNAYSNELATNFEPKVSRSIVPISSWQMSTKPVSKALQSEIIPGRQAISDTRSDLQFFRYDARDQLVSGAALMFTNNASNRLTQVVGGRLESAFPQLGKPEFTHIWSGYVGITPDRFPHFHQIGPGYYAAIGFNGRGVALSIAVGREMAEAISGGNSKDSALPFSTARQIPFHSITRRVSPAALAYYRWRDNQISK